jgi:hypothetical protein
VVAFVDQPGPRLGFAEFEVRGALGFDHVFGRAQPYPAVDLAAACGALDGDLIAAVDATVWSWPDTVITIAPLTATEPSPQPDPPMRRPLYLVSE